MNKFPMDEYMSFTSKSSLVINPTDSSVSALLDWVQPLKRLNQSI